MDYEKLIENGYEAQRFAKIKTLVGQMIKEISKDKDDFGIKIKRDELDNPIRLKNKEALIVLESLLSHVDKEIESVEYRIKDYV